MAKYDLIRGHIEHDLSRGLSPREVEDLFAKVCEEEPPDALGARAKGRIVRISEVYKSYFTDEAASRWMELTGVDVSGRDVKVPSGFLPKQKLLSLRANLQAEREDITERYTAKRTRTGRVSVTITDFSVAGLKRQKATALCDVEISAEEATAIKLPARLIDGGDRTATTEALLNTWSPDYQREVIHGTQSPHAFLAARGINNRGAQGRVLSWLNWIMPAPTYKDVAAAYQKVLRGELNHREFTAQTGLETPDIYQLQAVDPQSFPREEAWDGVFPPQTAASATPASAQDIPNLGPIEYQPDGSPVFNDKFAAHMARVAFDPQITHEWKNEDFLALVEKRLGHAPPVHKFQKMSKAHGFLPNMLDMRKRHIHKIMLTAQELFRKRGIASNWEMAKVLNEEFGFKIKSKNQFKGFDRHFPELRIDFVQATIERAKGEALEFLQLIRADPDLSYIDVAVKNGVPKESAPVLVKAIHDYFPGELEKRAFTKWTAEDMAVIETALEDAPLSGTIEDFRSIVCTEDPGVLERHPGLTADVLLQAIKRNFEFTTWSEFRQQRYAAVFADFTKRAPPDATKHDIVRAIQDEHPGAYSYMSSWRLLKKWRKDPKKFPQIAELLEPSGDWPWANSRVRYTTRLAKRVQ